MSYILDALKKAEAERHVGQVPSLYAQPAVALPPNATSAHRGKALFAIATTLVLLSAWLAWQYWQKDTPASPAFTPIMASTAAPPTILPSALPETTQIVAINPLPEPPKPTARAVTKPHSAPRIRTKDTKKKNNDDLKLSTAITPEAGAASTGELPDHIRHELPNLAIGGYIYSDNPDERQLLVNRRLLHEGSEAAPGVTLEKMLPTAAVFIYKGYRFRLSY